MAAGTPSARGGSSGPGGPLRVVVLGLGYIGLPTAAVLATHGAQVVGVDVDAGTVGAVNRGEVPFVEPDLSAGVAGAVSRGWLRAQATVPGADVFVVAVPTPLGADHGADLRHVDQAADAIAPRLAGGELVVLESTAPPGTTRRLADRILAARPDLSLDGSGQRPVVHVVHCPERVLPGRVMVELITNDRIIGGLTPEAARRGRDVYRTFCQGEILLTDAATAELAKLVENAYRDVNIAFANEVALISAELGVDGWELIELANRHPRVDILRPGPGVGGHCIAVDPWFLVAAAPQQARLIRAARGVNDARPQAVVEDVVRRARRFPRPRVAALGLAFKPDIDDLRESPSVRIVAEVAARLPHATVAVVEPHVTELPPGLADLRNVSLEPLAEAVAQADVVLLLVDHAQFRAADPEALRLRDKVLVDTRGLWR
jgi:UDP-N-acetyl-D-mannosaminuronic acid dehydrogenase